jgi:hypothetical protein
MYSSLIRRSTSVSDAADLVRDVFKKHIARGGVNYDLPYSAELSEVANHLWESQVKDGVDFSVEDRTQLVFYFTKHIRFAVRVSSDPNNTADLCVLARDSALAIQSPIVSCTTPKLQADLKK